VHRFPSGIWLQHETVARSRIFCSVPFHIYRVIKGPKAGKVGASGELWRRLQDQSLTVDGRSKDAGTRRRYAPAP
jgi:hypothetical protein